MQANVAERGPRLAVGFYLAVALAFALAFPAFPAAAPAASEIHPLTTKGKIVRSLLSPQLTSFYSAGA